MYSLNLKMFCACLFNIKLANWNLETAIELYCSQGDSLYSSEERQKTRNSGNQDQVRPADAVRTEALYSGDASGPEPVVVDAFRDYRAEAKRSRQEIGQAVSNLNE